LPSGSRLAVDDRQQTVVLFPEEWACNFFVERNPKIKLLKLPGQEQTEVLTPANV